MLFLGRNNMPIRCPKCKKADLWFCWDIEEKELDKCAEYKCENCDYIKYLFDSGGLV